MGKSMMERDLWSSESHCSRGFEEDSGDGSVGFGSERTCLMPASKRACFSSGGIRKEWRRR